MFKIVTLLIFALLISIVPDAALAKSTTLKVTVTEKGFVPAQLQAQPGDDVTLKITRKTETTCATAVQIPSLKIRKPLPLNKTVTIALGKLEKGDIKFGCTMDMMESATIHVN